MVSSFILFSISANAENPNSNGKENVSNTALYQPNEYFTEVQSDAETQNGENVEETNTETTNDAEEPDTSVPSTNENVDQTEEATQTDEDDLQEDTQMQTEPEEQVTQPVEPVISAYGPGEAYVYVFSADEMEMMAKEVYAEAGNQSYEGMVAVAAVFCNRWASDLRDFDYDSMSELLTAKYQFADISWVTSEDLDKVPDCRKAVEDACRGWDPTRVKFENGALFFYNPKYCSEAALKARENLDVLIIGDHYFHDSL